MTLLSLAINNQHTFLRGLFGRKLWWVALANTVLSGCGSNQGLNEQQIRVVQREQMERQIHQSAGNRVKYEEYLKERIAKGDAPPANPGDPGDPMVICANTPPELTRIDFSGNVLASELPSPTLLCHHTNLGQAILRYRLWHCYGFGLDCISSKWVKLLTVN